MKLLLTILILSVMSVSGTYGQSPVLVNDPLFQESARVAIDSLYNRNPDGAREVMEPWRQTWPEHPVWTLMEGMEVWWLVLTDLFDESHDEELTRLMTLAEEQASRLLDEQSDHPDALIIKAAAHGYIARQLSNRNRWLPSINTARKAMNAHEALGKAAPDLTDNLFAEGLKKYYAAYLPEAYPVIRAVAWLLPSGDKQLGLEYLEQTSESAVFARPEAIYFLGNILLNYEEEYEKAIIHFERLVEMYPRNSYYRRLYVRALYQNNRNREAATAIRDALDYWEGINLNDEAVLQEELLYWSGRVKMRMSTSTAAHRDLAAGFEVGKRLPNLSDRSFHVLNGYYAGLTAEWSGDPESARYFYESVTELEAESHVRSQAEERLKQLD